MHWILELRNRHLFIIDSLTLAIIPALALTLLIGGFGWWPERSRALFSYHLLPIWVIFPALSSLFFIEGIPAIQTKIKQLVQREDIKNET